LDLPGRLWMLASLALVLIRSHLDFTHLAGTDPPR